MPRGAWCPVGTDGGGALTGDLRGDAHAQHVQAVGVGVHGIVGMGVGIDEAGRQGKTLGIDDFLRTLQVGAADLGDFAVFDADRTHVALAAGAIVNVRIVDNQVIHNIIPRSIRLVQMYLN